MIRELGQNEYDLWDKPAGDSISVSIRDGRNALPSSEAHGKIAASPEVLIPELSAEMGKFRKQYSRAHALEPLPDLAHILSPGDDINMCTWSVDTSVIQDRGVQYMSFVYPQPEESYYEQN